MQGFYDVIAESYDELYQEEQQEKIDLIKPYLNLKKSDHLLDVGCGTAFYLDDFNCQCIGVDPSEKMLSFYSGKQNVLVAVAENLPFQANDFDVVTSFTAIQNFKNIKKGLDEIKRVGTDLFVLTFIKRNDLAKLIKNLIYEIFFDFEIQELNHSKDFILILRKKHKKINSY
jgi:ubiquinone/menaquinone biosynthesis C-methylase UbiE